MMYEVAGIEVLTGPDYAQRLNNPTPWTSWPSHDHLAGHDAGGSSA